MISAQDHIEESVNEAQMETIGVAQGVRAGAKALNLNLQNAAQMQYESLPIVSRWYVAAGAMPVLIPVQLTGETHAWFPSMYQSIPNEQLFEREQDALQYALKQKNAAREMWEREYDALMKRIDEVDSRETV